MEIIYLQEALNDINYWKKSGNKSIQKRIQSSSKALRTRPTKALGNRKV